MMLEPGMPVVCVDATEVENELTLGANYVVQEVATFEGIPLVYLSEVPGRMVEIEIRWGGTISVKKEFVKNENIVGHCGPGAGAFRASRFRPRYGEQVRSIINVTIDHEQKEDA